MLDLKDGFVFYHGSYCEVKEPDLAKCAKRKDFGQGFYQIRQSTTSIGAMHRMGVETSFNYFKGAGRKFFENFNSKSNCNREN